MGGVLRCNNFKTLSRHKTPPATIIARSGGLFCVFLHHFSRDLTIVGGMGGFLLDF